MKRWQNPCFYTSFLASDGLTLLCFVLVFRFFHVFLLFVRGVVMACDLGARAACVGGDLVIGGCVVRDGTGVWG